MITPLENSIKFVPWEVSTNLDIPCEDALFWSGSYKRLASLTWVVATRADIIFCLSMWYIVTKKIERIKNEFNVLLAWQISEGIYWRVLISKLKLNQIWSCSSRHKLWVFFMLVCVFVSLCIVNTCLQKCYLHRIFFCLLFSMDSIVLFWCCWLEETIFTKIHTFLTLVFRGTVCLNFVNENDFHLYPC